MKCKYDIENIYPIPASFEQTKEIVCKKMARIIILMESDYYDNQCI